MAVPYDKQPNPHTRPLGPFLRGLERPLGPTERDRYRRHADGSLVRVFKPPRSKKQRLVMRKKWKLLHGEGGA